MYDPVTLDQLRALVAVIEEGSFSAAARKLQRVQSAISTSMANLESQLGVPVWDRATKVARLTPQGQAVLASARRVLAEVDGLKRLTSGMSEGLEATVSLCVDALLPLEALIQLCTGFAKEFPTVDLRIDVQVMSAVSAQVLAGKATLGVVIPPAIVPGLERRALSAIRMVPVVSPKHPLAAVRGLVSNEAVARTIQIVLSERGAEGVADQGVLSPRTWRVGDLHTKHMMLRTGLGWGNLPEHLVRSDLRARRLVEIRLEAWAKEEHVLNLSAVYRSETVFGPAHRWLLERLGTLCTAEAANAKSVSSSRKRLERSHRSR
jgi:DNA-binding transcriptional LysR family regulator